MQASDPLQKGEEKYKHPTLRDIPTKKPIKADQLLGSRSESVINKSGKLSSDFSKKEQEKREAAKKKKEKKKKKKKKDKKDRKNQSVDNATDQK